MVNFATSAKARWWITAALFFVFLLAPGGERSPFSGAPLSSRGVAIFFAAVLVAVFTALYAPSRAIRWRWPALFAVLIIIKVGLAPLHLPTGWKAQYWSSATWTKTGTSLRQAEFLTNHQIRSYRFDRAIDFEGINFGLDFLNDIAPPTAEYLPAARDVQFPLKVVWEGWTRIPAGQPVQLTLSANGALRVSVDGRQVTSVRNPSAMPVALPPSSGELRHVVVEYHKPLSTKPLVAVHGFAGVVTPSPFSTEELNKSKWAARGVTAAGLLAFIVLGLALMHAYPRLSVFALEHVWAAPTKLAAFAFFAFFIALGIGRTIPERHATILENLGDDPLFYESTARLIIRDGLLMADPFREPSAYYFYPFYSYALAGAHLLLGEDFANVTMFNYVCIASLGLLFWALLRNRVSTGAGIFVVAALALFAYAAMLHYVRSAYTDNLYLPLSLAVITVCVTALDRRSNAMLWLAGILTALASATRPSFLFFLPLFGLWLLFDREIGPFRRRVAAGVSFGVGFASGVAPFTFRNWIVTHRFVMLVSSYIMLPHFLYPPENPPTDLMVNGRPPNLGESLEMVVRIVSERPFGVIWLELRKILYTLGLTDFGPAGLEGPRYFVVFTVLFALALWSKRIPRNLRNVILVFATSHMVAMVVAAPYSYGYKNILPLHVVFLLTAAFLLPNWGEQRTHARIPDADDDPVRKPLVSVILPTYNEKDSIRRVIQEFFATGVADEVLVINNNAVPGTSEEVAGTGAREIVEPRQGYGAAIRRGMKEATGDYLVICEPDGTFVARDIHKLIAYAKDFDVVYGSRTSQELVWQGANMGVFLRWGNWAVAKYLEFLYNATSLTDVGCTMRLIRRDVARALEDEYRIDGNQFGPEMMILSLRAGYRVVQIPVNYRERVGVSSVTGDPSKAFWLGLQMIWLITSRRFEDSVIKPPPRDLPSPAARGAHS